MTALFSIQYFSFPNDGRFYGRALKGFGAVSDDTVRGVVLRCHSFFSVIVMNEASVQNRHARRLSPFKIVGDHVNRH